MDERLMPPDDVRGADIETAEWRMEYDVVTTLRKLGHEVSTLGVGSDLGAIRRAVEESKPHTVFNLLEDFHDVPIYDQNLVSYLELLRVPYTGCNPRGLMLARDKAISKTLLSFHRVPVPDFFVVRTGKAPRRPKRLRFPLIVKSLTKEGSAGIALSSLVDDEAKLAERVRFVHEHLGTDAIVEQYVDGRELYVGVLGNERLQVLPPWELHFTRMPEDLPRIATDRVKWSRAYQQKRGIKTGPAKDLPEGVAQRLPNLCKRVYRVLQLSGCARIDFRLDAEGRLYVLEANPNPQLARGEDLAASAEHAAISYEALIQRLVGLGMRWAPDGHGG
jgi:D-alanine-D-alanine ligase